MRTTAACDPPVAGRADVFEHPAESRPCQHRHVRTQSSLDLIGQHRVFASGLAVRRKREDRLARFRGLHQPNRLVDHRVEDEIAEQLAEVM